MKTKLPPINDLPLDEFSLRAFGSFESIHSPHDTVSSPVSPSNSISYQSDWNGEIRQANTQPVISTFSNGQIRFSSSQVNVNSISNLQQNPALTQNAQLMTHNQNVKYALKENNLENNSSKIVGKGPWTIQEDKMLLDAMRTFSGHICWEELSKMIPGRTAKQCRERWQFRLHPDVSKSPFEQWEDDLIIRERSKVGNHWTHIAMMLPGRTSCSVKNRWYTVLRHRKNNKIQRRPKTFLPTTPFYYETLLIRDKSEKKK